MSTRSAAESADRWKSHPWIAGRIDQTLRTLEGRPADDLPAPLSFFDLTRWRRKPAEGVTVRPKTFGERLRARRLELGLSQVQVGRLLGVGRATVYRWERDDWRPNRRRMEVIRDFLESGPRRRS